MSRKEVTTKEDFMTVIDILENAEITYWIDGGWGVDILAGNKQEIIEILILILIPDIQKNCCIFFMNMAMKSIRIGNL